MTGKHILAKTSKDRSQWLPLWMHSRDTAGVMSKLVDHWVTDATLQAMKMERGELRQTAVLLGYLHDIGKATSKFQSMITKQLPQFRQKLNARGFSVLEENEYPNRTKHAYMGEWILSAKRDEYPLPEGLAEIIGAHHGHPLDDRNDAEGTIMIDTYQRNFYGYGDPRRSWNDLWNKIIEDAMLEAGVRSPEEVCEITPPARVLLSGLLITADWIASNVTYFPLLAVEETGDRNVYPGRILRGWNKLRFPSRWVSKHMGLTSELFRDKFGFLPNGLQEGAIGIAEAVTEPGIMIIEAPMGVGKTEAALAAVEILAGKTGQGGMFFGLPTQATSNGIFPRLLHWAEKETEELTKAIKLAHGAAQFNEYYEELVLQGQALVDEIDGEHQQGPGVEVHPWFAGSKRALLADFVIGTVDQFLMCAVKQKHFMLRHLGASGKVVVIDECHAYDAYMNRYLDQAVRWMAAYRVPVILLSATLPSRRRSELVDAYARTYARCDIGRGAKPVEAATEWKSSRQYPLITWTDGNVISQNAIGYEEANTQVSVSHVNGAQELIETLRLRIRNGGCAVLIVNTVRKAQDLYELICEGLGQTYSVLLYHAQFCAPDRAEKEADILRKLGKGSTGEDRDGTILIGTQVLEQSLDYDADVMFSEPCPMDLLLQRIGRLHRHRGRPRPPELEAAELVLIMDEDGSCDKGTGAVYGEYLLSRTLKLLPETIDLPGDIPDLVQRTYDFADSLDMEDQKYREMEEEYMNEQRGKTARAQFLLEKPNSMKSLVGILSNSGDLSQAQAEASVRDGDPAIEVVVLSRTEQGLMRMISYKNRSVVIDPLEELSSHTARIIAGERLRLPHAFTGRWNIKRTIEALEEGMKELPADWRASPWLQHGYILLLDQDMQGEIGDCNVAYDYEKGFQYWKKGGSNGGKKI